MKKYLIIILLLNLFSDANALTVNSCGGNFSVKMIRRGTLLIEYAGRKMGLVKIDHDVSGGLFDSAGKLLVVYGLPYITDLRSPQAEYLSVYLVKPRPRMIIRRTYGGGVYDVAFGVDSNLILVSSRFGFDVVNVKTTRVESFGPMSEPKFSRQQCNNH